MDVIFLRNMKSFVQLYNMLDQTNKTNDKLSLLVDYFTHADDKEKIIALALFCGRRPKRTVNTTLLRKWAAEIAQIPEWLFEETYHTVGDLAETISLLVNHEHENSAFSLTSTLSILKKCEEMDELEKKEIITNQWTKFAQLECLVFNKLITGGFRIGVSQKLIEKALSSVLNLPASDIAYRLSGKWDIENSTFHDLLLSDKKNQDLSKPYPFCLAHPLTDTVESLGKHNEWLAEWKWDGIRGQLIKRDNEVFLWSRGEELITNRFTDLTQFIYQVKADFVIDGEIVLLKDNQILSFNDLQKRIGRKNISKKMMQELPAAFIVYDLLELNKHDLRESPLEFRKSKLNELILQFNSSQIFLSETVDFNSWSELAEKRKNARMMKSEGLMLKHKNSVYSSGRKRGDWWKWKLDPYSVDAVMIYAMKGHGRRSNLYTDYTFAIWNDRGELVPFTKAYSGLTDKEIVEVDAFVRKNTIEKFGPVRSVKPELVFEIGFEGIQKSARHKSGVALRFPRMLRWRKDKLAHEADTLSNLSAFL